MAVSKTVTDLTLAGWSALREAPMDMETLALRVRFGHLMYRHLRLEDAKLSDRELVKAAMDRWQKDQEAPLIDPAE
jgi:hypothetical protein